MLFLYPKCYWRYKFGREKRSIFEPCYRKWINNKKAMAQGLSIIKKLLLNKQKLLKVQKIIKKTNVRKRIRTEYFGN